MSKISIIVPVYKVEKYLDRCVKSILAQTYTDFELILVDDGSPDNCPAMCDAWAKKDNRIRVIHKENGGVSSARNVGITISTGEYIFFIDSDDYVLPKYIENMMVKNKIDFLSSGYTFIKNNNISYEPLPDINITTTQFRDNPNMYAMNVFYSNSCYKRYKSSIIKKNKIAFPVDISYGEDLKFSMDYILNSETIASIPNTEYCYCVRKNSAFQSFSPTNFMFALSGINYRHQLFDNQFLNTEIVFRTDYRIYRFFLNNQKNYSIKKTFMRMAVKNNHLYRSLLYLQKHGSLDEKVNVFCTLHKIPAIDCFLQKIFVIIEKSKSRKKQ